MENAVGNLIGRRAGSRSTRCVPWIATGAAVVMACTNGNAATSDTLTSDEAREAYSLGVALAGQIRGGLAKVDPDAFSTGVFDVMHERELALTQVEIGGAIADYERRLISIMEAEHAEIAASNAAAGEAYRKSFAEDPEVVTLASGLLYKVIQAGEGDVAKRETRVTIHYTASKIDGEEFDNTRELGEAVELNVSDVMPGWTEALTRMNPGAKWTIVVPPELAYGVDGYGSMIEPNDTLIFKLEMLSAS